MFLTELKLEMDLWRPQQYKVKSFFLADESPRETCQEEAGLPQILGETFITVYVPIQAKRFSQPLTGQKAQGAQRRHAEILQTHC